MLWKRRSMAANNLVELTINYKKVKPGRTGIIIGYDRPTRNGFSRLHNSHGRLIIKKLNDLTRPTSGPLEWNRQAH